MSVAGFVVLLTTMPNISLALKKETLGLRGIKTLPTQTCVSKREADAPGFLGP